MKKQQIIDIIVETIETGLRNQAPKDVPKEALEQFINSGRNDLITTASDIADKILAIE